MRYICLILATAFGILGVAAAYLDFAAGERRWSLLGEMWFTWSPTSLQVSEAIISRYLDPCGAIVALGCAPFLWHPMISTLLGFYAAPALLIACLVFALLSRYLGIPKNRY